MATFTDDFNRGTSDAVGGSSTESESFPTACRLLSNELRLTNSSSIRGIVYWTVPTTNNQYFEIEWRGINLAGSFDGLFVRGSGTYDNFTGYVFFLDRGGTPDVRLYKFQNEDVDLTTGKSPLAVNTITVNVGDILRIEVTGTTIRCLVNGDEKINHTDSDIASGNQIGMATFKVVTGAGIFSGLWDNAEGGDLGETGQVSDAMSFGDSGADGYSALGGDPSDALSFTESVAGALTPVSEEGISDALGFGDGGAAGALFTSLAGSVSDALSFAESVDAAQAVRAGPGMTVLGRLGLAEGDEYVSDVDVRHPSRFYEGRAQFGTIRRGAELPAALPQVADLSVRLADSDRRYRSLFASRFPRGREFDLRLLPEGEREIGAQQVFRGEVSRVSYPEGEVSIEGSDRLFAFLDETIPALGTKDHFPSIPGDQEQFIPLIFGDMIGSGGLIECPIVDPAAGRFAASRHRLEAVSYVEIKNEGDEEFSPTTQYQVLEETITDGGVDYPVQILRLVAPGIGPATKVRIQARGLQDSAGDAERNPAEVLRRYLLDVARQSTTILDAVLFDEAKARASAAGYLADGAIVRPITHREAISRITSSFNLLVFGNRWGQIACKLPTVAESNPLEVGELLTGVRSVTVSEAETAYNSFRYRFGRNYAAGDWATEQIYPNSPSQSLLGKTYETTLELWFVREAAVAQAVAGDVAGYYDPGAYRVELTLPGPEVVSELEIGSQISLTHYSGVDPSGNGWANRLFRVTDLEIGFDRDRYLEVRVKAVTTVQPPGEPVQALLDVDWGENSITGPYAFGGGLFYGIFRHGTDAKTLEAWRSVDWGGNWSRIAGPTLPNDIHSFDSYKHGSKIHVLAQETTGRVTYHRFDMVSNRWDLQSEQIQGSVSPLPSELWVAVCARRSNGQVVAFFCGANETVSSIERRRQFYSLRGTGGWSTPAQMGGGAYDYHGGRAIPGKGDFIHFFYERSPGDFTAATPDAYHQTLAGSSLSSAIRWKLSSLLWQSATHNVGQFATFQQADGEVFIYVPVLADRRYATIYRFSSKQDLDNIVTPYMQASPSIAFQGQSTPDGSTRYPHISAGATQEGVVHAVWSGFVSLSDETWEVYKRATNGAWVPPEGGTTCSNVLGNRCAMEDRLGALNPDFRWITKMNALFFDLGGDAWCARFFYPDFTASQITQLGVSYRPTVFELVNLDRDVPRAASWTLQALADALTE